jgi:hypothetical protein
MPRAVALALVSALLVAAGAGSAHADRDKTKACDLLKPREIREAFVVTEVGTGKKGGVGPSCLWDVNGGPDEGGGQIATLLQRGKVAREGFDLAHTVADDSVVTIDGLGREAFFSVDTVFVLATKRTLVYVQGLFPGPASLEPTDLQARLEALAQIAVGRA